MVNVFYGILKGMKFISYQLKTIIGIFTRKIYIFLCYDTQLKICLRLLKKFTTSYNIIAVFILLFRILQSNFIDSF